MKQKTAVDWLIDQLYDHSGHIDILDVAHLNGYWEEAKQMEKEQIIKSHCDGFYKSAEGWNGEYGLNDIDKISEEIKAEQYYNETYKK